MTKDYRSLGDNLLLVLVVALMVVASVSYLGLQSYVFWWWPPDLEVNSFVFTRGLLKD